MNILLSEIAPSLEIRLILDCFSIDFSCLIKRKKPIADTISNKRSINSPLVGSFAKAWMSEDQNAGPDKKSSK